MKRSAFAVVGVMFLCSVVDAQLNLGCTTLRTSGAVTLSASGSAGTPLWLLVDNAAGPATVAGHTLDLALSPALIIIESPVPLDSNGALSANFSLDASVLARTQIYLQLVGLDATAPGDSIVLSNMVHQVVHPRALTTLGANGYCSGSDPAYLGNDELCQVSLGFNFQFFGVDFTALTVDSNGLLSFVSPAASDPAASAASLASKVASIAVLWADLDPSAIMPVGDPRNRVYVDQESGQCCRIAWHQVQRAGSAAESTASCTLWADGSIVMEWGVVDGPATVGLNALSGVGMALVDLSASSNNILPAMAGFAEEFSSAAAFDLAGSVLSLHPDGQGGYWTRMN
jgi:hypothetical protein